MGKNTLMDSLMALAGQGNVLVVHRAMVDFAGNLETALLLSQLLYWTPRSRMDGWIAKTDEEWADEIFVSKYKVRKCRERLENKDIIETEVRRFAGNPTVHYRVRQTELSKAWTTFLRKRAPVLSKPKEPPSETERTITEITTEITTEVKDIPATPANPAHHPSIQAVRNVLQKYPRKNQYESIISVLGDDGIDEGLLARCWKEWCERGYNPVSIKWLTEWYVQGGPANGPRASPQKQRTYTGTDFRGRDE